MLLTAAGGSAGNSGNIQMASRATTIAFLVRNAQVIFNLDTSPPSVTPSAAPSYPPVSNTSQYFVVEFFDKMEGYAPVTTSIALLGKYPTHRIPRE